MVIMAQDIEIKEGYKRTEIGVIPEDWKVKELGELTTLLTNGFVGKATDFYTNSGDGVIYIQGFNVEENSYNLTGIKRVTLEFHKKHAKSCLREGDLLTIQTGEIGLTTIVTKELEGSNCHALIISRFEKNLDPKYFSYYFNSFSGRMRFKDIETGTTMKHLNVGDLHTWLVPSPPTKSEQHAIVTALSDIDALITSLGKLIAKKRDIKQATMQQLLTGKTRLPGFSGEWKIKMLREVANISRGASPRPIEDPKWFNEFSSIGWVRISDVTKSAKYLFNTTQYLSEQGVKQSRFVKKEDLIMSICATIGKPIIVKLDVCIHDGFVIFERPKVNTEYLYYYLALIENSWSKNGQTGSQMNLNTTIIENENISFPNNSEEQHAIATVLSDMDAEIAALEQKREKTRMVKQGMMQELLTGKTRLL